VEVLVKGSWFSLGGIAPRKGVSVVRQSKGPSVELFLTKNSRFFEPEKWTCLVDRQLVGFGFRSRQKARSNAFLYVRDEIGPHSREDEIW
jgi:hypothetical protein